MPTGTQPEPELPITPIERTIRLGGRIAFTCLSITVAEVASRFAPGALGLVFVVVGVVSAVVLPFRQQIWVRLAYEEDIAGNLYEDWRGWRGGFAVRILQTSRTVLAKRVSWLPGPEYLTDSGVCKDCGPLPLPNHQACSGEIVIRRYFSGERTSLTLASAPCTCPHPSHKADE